MEQTKTTRPPWRPTDYRPEFCEQVVEMAKEGKGPAEYAAAFDVCKRTIYSWQDAHPDFLHAMTRAKIHCQAWWESAGRSGMVGDKFNGTVWAKNMNCRFPDDWREVTRNEHTGADKGPIKVESDAISDLMRKLTRLAPTSTEGGDGGGLDR